MSEVSKPAVEWTPQLASICGHDREIGTHGLKLPCAYPDCWPDGNGRWDFVAPVKDGKPLATLRRTRQPDGGWRWVPTEPMMAK